MNIESINKRQFYPGRHIPASLTQMDYPELIYDEIDSFKFNDRLIADFISALKNICSERWDKGFLVSGLYGAGKSHFLKYVLFCLSKVYQNKAFSHLSQCLAQHSDHFIESDLMSVQQEIKSLSIDTVVFDTNSFCLPKKDLYYLLYKKILDLKGLGDKSGMPLGRAGDHEINLDSVCNELHSIVAEKTTNYRLVFFFEDLDLAFGRDVTYIFQFLELLRKFGGEFAGVVRVLCSCQMGGDFFANYPELCKVIDSQMNRYHLFIQE